MVVLHTYIGIQPNLKYLVLMNLKGVLERETSNPQMVPPSHLIFCTIQVRDAGNLLTRAGFTLPGVDVDEYVVRYSSGEKISQHISL